MAFQSSKVIKKVCVCIAVDSKCDMTIQGKVPFLPAVSNQIHMLVCGWFLTSVIHRLNYCFLSVQTMLIIIFPHLYSALHSAHVDKIAV